MFLCFLKILWSWIGSLVKNRKVQIVDKDSNIDLETYLVLIDSSKNPVKVILPKAIDFIGHLQLVVSSVSHSIDVEPNEGDLIFDDSSFNFNNAGDAFILVSDRKDKWFVVGRYNPQWYA